MNTPDTLTPASGPRHVAMWTVAGVLALAACSGGSAETTVPTTTAPTTTTTTTTTTTMASPSTTTAPATTTTAIPPSTTTAPATGDAGGGWLSLFTLVPDTPNNRTYIVATNYAAAAAISGVQAPPSGATDDQIRDYLFAVEAGPDPGEDGGRALFLAGPPATFGERFMSAPGDWRTEFGFTVVDVERDLIAGSPPGVVIFFEGRLDPDTVTAALHADPVWSSDLETVDHGTGNYFRWGDDYELDIRRTSAARPLGRGGQLAVGDGLVIRTYGSPEMEGALDSLGGRTATIADDPVAPALAGVLDEHGIYSAILIIDTAQFDAAEVPGLDGAGPRLAPFTGLAAGSGFDAATGDGFSFFAYAHEDTAAARENAVRLQALLDSGSTVRGRPWTEVFDEAIVSVEGTVVTVRLFREGAPSTWLQVVLARDTLVLWEAAA